MKNKAEYFKMLREIRRLYDMKITKAIFDIYPLRLSPYFYDWWKVFTLIEMNFWEGIRKAGLPMYPQYPVGKYYLDFGDPVNKIGIEIDSRQWHSGKQNLERDIRRQREIEELGWTIYRVTGAESFHRSWEIALEIWEKEYAHEPIGMIFDCLVADEVVSELAILKKPCVN